MVLISKRNYHNFRIGVRHHYEKKHLLSVLNTGKLKKEKNLLMKELIGD
jgi:hypothetical protein